MNTLITNWDLQILYKLHTFSSQELDVFFKNITHTADFKFMSVLLILLLVFQHTRKTGKQILVAELLQLAVGGYLLKHLIARARPFIVDPTIELIIKAPHSYSCPSGHSSTAFALAFVLVFSDCPIYWKLLAFIWAVIICLSRLYLQVHFPTDVILGALLGFCCAYVSHYLICRK